MLLSWAWQALAFLGREPDGRPQPHLKHWRELFAEREQRLYYVNDEASLVLQKWVFPQFAGAWQRPTLFRVCLEPALL